MAKRLYTLSAVAEKTGISINSLLRYKKRHQDRIPSVGEGRRQRYPREAFTVFKQIKQENLANRGLKSRSARKKQKVSKAKRSAPRPTAARAGQDLLTLKKVAGLSQISYGTAARYAKTHGDRIPSVGKGRKRRYPLEAIAVFKAIRTGSRPGRKPGARKSQASKPSPRAHREVSNAALAQRIERVEQTLTGLSKQLRQIERDVNKPLRVTIGG